MNKEFKRGDQVAYIPNYANADIDHPYVEFGFITSIDFVAFVRYWSKKSPNELRTKANSEATPIANLVHYRIKQQEEIDELLKTL